MEWSLDNYYNISLRNYSESLSLSNGSITADFYPLRMVLLKYYMWLFFAVGLPGNTLTIVTISKFQYGGPASFLLCYLAAIDNFALVAKLIEMTIFYYLDYMFWSPILCKTVSLPSVIFTAVSNWTVILLCAERYIAVCQPLKRKIWITNKRCKITVSLIFACLTVLYTTLFLVFVDKKDTCIVLYLEFTYFFLLQIIIGVATPFVFITILTVSVIKVLFIARGKRLKLFRNAVDRQEQNFNEIRDQNSVRKSERMEITLSRLMISTALVYFILSGPFCIHTLVVLPIYEWNFEAGHFAYLIKDIFFILMDASHLLNAFVYFVFVSGFRTNVYRFFKSIFSICELSQDTNIWES